MASRDPPATRDDLIKPYYRATQAMLRLVLDLDCQIHLPLATGDCLVLDNHRILHGRTGMDPVASRARRFRRFDVERDAAQTRMRQLSRDLGRARLRCYLPARTVSALIYDFASKPVYGFFLGD